MKNSGFGSWRREPKQCSTQAKACLRVRPLASYSCCVRAHGQGCVVREHRPSGIHEHGNSVSNNSIVGSHCTGIREKCKVCSFSVEVGNTETVESLARRLQLG